MSIFDGMVSVSGFMPHGMCIRWSLPVLIPMVLGDALLFLAYMFISLNFFRLIPVQFGYITARLKPEMYLFGLFIFSCGMTHLMSVIVVWWPIYQAQALVVLFTGVVSTLTAVVLLVRRKAILTVFVGPR